MLWVGVSCVCVGAIVSVLAVADCLKAVGLGLFVARAPVLQQVRPPLRPELQAFDSNVSAAVVLLVCACVMWACGRLGVLIISCWLLEGC